MSPQIENPGSRVVRKIRVRAVFFLILAVVAGLGAVYLVKRYLDQARRAAEVVQSQTTPIVVAALEIPIATALTAQHLALASWPSKSVPPGAYTTIKEVLGRTVRVSLIKGEPILMARLADEKRGKGLAAILAKGMRAMAVKVNQVIGVSGYVQPGDFVDVIVTMRPDEESSRKLNLKASAVAKVILQNIKVLAVGAHMVTEGNKPVKVPAVTLEVNPEQSERLALASRHGGIVLTMRSRIDQEEVPTAGMTPVALLTPDEGAEARETVVAKVDTAPEPRRRTTRRRTKPEEPKKPEAPVVEVLRGGSVETRKLRPSADSQ